MNEKVLRLAAIDGPSPEDIKELAAAMPVSGDDPIEEFQGDARFLSNFYESPVEYRGVTYRNAEAAFQAQKCRDRSRCKDYAALSASAAKRAGRREDLRPDWEQIKITEMYRIVRAKFAQDATLAWRLLDTGDRRLVEGNSWNDTFWGVCRGEGRNWLGTCLMAVRAVLKSAAENA